jgi:hypothetical protein
MEINPIATSMVNTIVAPGQVDFAEQANGQKLTLDSASEIVDMATATGTGTGTVTSTTAMVPAGALILGVTSRVLTVLTGASLTTWSLGVAGATTRYATGIALTAGTTTTMANHLVTVSPIFVATAVGLVFTAAAGVFSTGTVRITTHFLKAVVSVN